MIRVIGLGLILAFALCAAGMLALTTGDVAP